MIAAEETFDGTFPFAPRFSRAAGFRMHYVDEGEGEPIVLLHGQPTWGYLYRAFVRPLAGTHRVVVPDHMGFGKSETPSDREYTLQTHVENLTALVEELDLEEVTLVMHDWGGPIGGGWAMRHPERVKRLVLLNTVIGVAPDAEGPPRGLLESPWFRWIRRSLEDGSYEEVLGNLGSTVVSVMKLIGFENSAAVDETWIRAYSAPFPTREACRGAIAFPKDIATGAAIPHMREAMAGFGGIAGKPALLIEGARDRAIPPPLAIGGFRELFPDAPVVQLEGAGHFCQEDAPEAILAAIRVFLETT